MTMGARNTEGRSKHDNRKGRESVRKRIGKRTAAAIEARDGHRCVYCGIHQDDCERHMHFDHLDPRSEGGEDAATNLVLTCEPCNSARKTMTLRQWKAYAAVKRGLVIDLRKVRAQARKALPS